MDDQVLVDDLRHAAEIVKETDVHHRRGRFVEALNRHADRIEGTMLKLDETTIPRADTTIRELREWLKGWIEKSRSERGEAFDIEGALRVTDMHVALHVTKAVRDEYRDELQRKYRTDPNRCVYCGSNLELYPGSGHYCDICADKFNDFDTDEWYGDEDQ